MSTDLPLLSAFAHMFISLCVPFYLAMYEHLVKSESTLLSVYLIYCVTQGQDRQAVGYITNY